MRGEGDETVVVVEPLSYPGESVAWVAVAILSLLYLLGMIDRYFITLLQGAIKADLHITDFQLSLLYGAAFAVVFAFAGLFAGWVVDRFSRRKVVFWSVVVWSLSAASCGLSRTFGALAAARAGVGIGESGITPTSHSVLADMFRPHRLALPLSVYALGGKLGQSLSFLIGSFVATVIAPAAIYQLANGWYVHGWQLAFVVVGLPGLVLAFLIFTIPEPGRHRPAGGSEGGFGEYARFMRANPRFFTAHHLAAMIMTTVSVGMTSWAPAYFERVHGLSVTSTGLWMGIALLVGPTLGLPLHGAMTDRLFRNGRGDAHLVYLAAAAALSTPIGIAAFLVSSTAVSLVLLTVFAALISGYLSLPATALQLAIPGSFRGKSSAVFYLTAAQPSITFGPMIVASFTDFVFRDPQKVGLSISLTIALLMPLTALVMAAAFKPVRELARARRSEMLPLDDRH